MLISYININPKNISTKEQIQMMDAFVKEHVFLRLICGIQREILRSYC